MTLVDGNEIPDGYLLGVIVNLILARFHSLITIKTQVQKSNGTT